MPPRYALVAFDLYGTLLDVAGLAGRLGQLLGRDAVPLLAAWRKGQLTATWELVRAGQYQPFDRVTAAALAKVAPEVDEALRARLAAEWLALPPYPDAAAALDHLAGAGMRTAILSNGTRPMIESALAAAGLRVSAVRSVDEIGTYKPDPRVYALLDEMAPRADTLFVSANGWDAGGAKGTGRNVCWIDRGGGPPDLTPDLQVRSLAELAATIA